MAKREGTKAQTTQWPREKWQKDKQYNGQERSDKRTNNTMAKREGTKGQRMIYKSLYSIYKHPDYSHCQHIGGKKLNFYTQKRLKIPKRKLEAINHRITNNTMANREGTKGQTIQWPREKGQKDKQNNGQERRDKRTNNTMAKREVTKGQTIQWPREKGQKDKQYNGQERRDKRTNNIMAKREGTKGQTIQWPREKGQKNKQYNGQEKRDKRTNKIMAKREGTKGQTIQWPREK
jgi:hypothetical protein